jgi:dTMP kinase
MALVVTIFVITNKKCVMIANSKNLIRKYKQMKSNIIIDIEGIDGVGKGTQSKILFERLQSVGYSTELISFPKYETFFGKMIGQYLNGKYGDLKSVPVEFAALLYASDRWNHFKNFNCDTTTAHKVTVSDRYVTSNIAHQASKLPKEKRSNFISWLLQLEHEVFCVPKPALVLILDASPSITRNYVLLKNARSYTAKKMDIHESDTQYLEEVRNVFVELAKTDKKYHVINCTDGQNLKPIEQISETIWEIVSKFIG